MAKKEKRIITEEDIRKYNLSTEKLYAKDENWEMENFNSLLDTAQDFKSPDIEVVPFFSKNDNGSVKFYTGNELKPGHVFFLVPDEVILPGDFFITYKNHMDYNVVRSTSKILPNPNTKKIYASSNQSLSEKGVRAISDKFLKELERKPTIHHFISSSDAFNACLSPAKEKFRDSFRNSKASNEDPFIDNLNSNSMSTKIEKVGFAKIHVFEENAEKGTKEGQAYNITLFEKEMKSITPENGKIRLYIMENPNDPEKFSILTGRNKEDYSKTKLYVDLTADSFKDNKAGLTIKNGYIDLTASKMNGKDSFSVYQHQTGQPPKYVGFATEPSNDVYVGNAFNNKSDAGYEYISVAANPSKLNTEKNTFINVHKSETKENALVAFASNKPSKNAVAIIQLSKKGKEFIKTLANNEDIRMTVSSRNPENITPQVNFSDLNVSYFDKDTKERTYLGSAWSNEKFNSLPQDVQTAIANNLSVAQSHEKAIPASEKYKVGLFVEFSCPKDYYLNAAIDKGIIDSPTAIGKITEVNDKQITVESPVGNVKIDIPVSKENAAVISESNKLNYTQFSDSYSMIKSQIDESLKPKKGSKQTKGKAESKSNEKTTEKGKSQSKPKASKKGEEMSM